ncbi:MAG: type IV pilus assembly protein PilM [Candidatus Omnitrophota bacterium]
MRRVVGIDIGKHSIKLVEIEERKKDVELTKCGIIRVANKDIKTALKNLILAQDITAKRINVSLAGLSVIVRYIEMPAMKKEELKSSIKFEAEKYIPFNLKDSIIDCAMLDKTASGQQRVILVAVKRNEVEELIALFKDTGLNMNIIDIDSFAFLNSFQRLNIEGVENKTYALLNIGEKLSNMNIITNGNAFFTRDILWGGSDLTNRIKDTMGTNLEEAEEIKENGIDRKDEIEEILSPVLERLSLQIRMSFDYFESQFGKTVDTIYLSGGTSYLFNIVDFFKDSLGIETLMWNPFEGINIQESVNEMAIERTPSLFAVAVGLALRK